MRIFAIGCLAESGIDRFAAESGADGCCASAGLLIAKHNANVVMCLRMSSLLG